MFLKQVKMESKKDRTKKKTYSISTLSRTNALDHIKASEI